MISNAFGFMIFFFFEILIFAILLYLMTNSDLANESFSSIYRGFITMFSASLGMSSYSLLNEDVAAEMLFSIFLVLNMVVILNVIIAMLTKIYDKDSERAETLYMMDIADLRELYEYNDQYGALISSFFPFNFLACSIASILFIILIKSQKLTRSINSFFLFVEYIILFPIFLAVYFFIELILIPFVFLKVFFQKIFDIFHKHQNHRISAFLQAVFFFFFGIFFLIFVVVIDSYKFTRHCFETQRVVTITI